MHGRRHVHVNNNEIVVSRLGSRIFASWEFAWCFEDALNCSDVLLPLILGEVATI